MERRRAWLLRILANCVRDHARARRELPLNQRQVVTLVDLEDCSYVEVGEILEIPDGTVMSRLCRAWRALRERLTPFASELLGNRPPRVK